jgi:hypothetical protein
VRIIDSANSSKCSKKVLCYDERVIRTEKNKVMENHSVPPGVPVRTWPEKKLLLRIGKTFEVML